MTNLLKKADLSGMSKPKVNFKGTLQELMKFSESYNARIKTARAIDPNFKLQPLKSIHITLMKEIVRKLQGQIIAAVKNGIPPDQMILHTNNYELGKDILCSKSTVQRAIKRLMEAQLVTFKIFRGTKANYALYINPDLITFECQDALRIAYQKKTDERVQAQKEKLGLPFLDKKVYKRSKCPVSSTIGTDILINKTIACEEENLQKSKSDFSIGERKRSPLSNSSSKGKRIHPAAIKMPVFTEKRDEYLWIKSLELLNYSIETLYKPNGIEIYWGAYANALDLVFKSWFKDIKTASQADRRMRQYRWRINFQARQLKKEGSFILPPSEYFSLERTKGGFRGTKQFFEQWKKSDGACSKKKAKSAEYDRIIRGIIESQSFANYNTGLERIKILYPKNQAKLEEFFSRIKQAQNSKTP